MSASDHLQPKQLSMFMPAGAIVAHPYMEGGRSPEGRASLMAGKRSDNASSRPYSKVNAPVVLAHGYEHDSPVLFEGHHRTIGAFDRSPKEEVPVIHIDSSRESYQEGRKQYPQSF